jgi:hypothetical protein
MVVHNDLMISSGDRIALAVAVVLIDLALFAVPLTGLMAAYLILARPPWFRAWVERLYEGP